MFSGSWRTSLGGFVAGIIVLLGQAQTLLDSDPKTNPEYTICMGAIAGIVALWNARDNVVTSEKAGIKK